MVPNQARTINTRRHRDKAPQAKANNSTAVNNTANNSSHMGNKFRTDNSSLPTVVVISQLNMIKANMDNRQATDIRISNMASSSSSTRLIRLSSSRSRAGMGDIRGSNRTLRRRLIPGGDDWEKSGGKQVYTGSLA